MRNVLISIIVTALITFTVTENYILSDLSITGTSGTYQFTVFGNTFNYQED